MCAVRADRSGFTTKRVLITSHCHSALNRPAEKPGLVGWVACMAYVLLRGTGTRRSDGIDINAKALPECNEA
jgi:hypothetical protein